MTELTQALTHKTDKKGEFVYLKNVPVYYASVLQPKKKYESNDKEYTLTAFVNDTIREKLEDEVIVNKSLYKVGVDKNKKRKVKYDAETYKDVADMSGITLTCPEFAKSGNRRIVVVLDSEGKPLTENIGNGSICTIKLMGYRNQDDMLVVSLAIVKVEELIPYEGGDGEFTDEEMGVTYTVNTKKDSDTSSDAGESQDTSSGSTDDMFDESDFED